MVVGLQLPFNSLLLAGAPGRPLPMESETIELLSFGEMLKLKEKQLQGEQLVSASSIAAALASLQTQALALPALLPAVQTNDVKIDSSLDGSPQAAVDATGTYTSSIATQPTTASLVPTDSVAPVIQTFSNDPAAPASANRTSSETQTVPTASVSTFTKPGIANEIENTIARPVITNDAANITAERIVPELATALRRTVALTHVEPQTYSVATVKTTQPTVVPVELKSETNAQQTFTQSMPKMQTPAVDVHPKSDRAPSSPVQQNAPIPAVATALVEENYKTEPVVSPPVSSPGMSAPDQVQNSPEHGTSTFQSHTVDEQPQPSVIASLPKASSVNVEAQTTQPIAAEVTESQPFDRTKSQPVQNDKSTPSTSRQSFAAQTVERIEPELASSEVVTSKPELTSSDNSLESPSLSSMSPRTVIQQAEQHASESAFAENELVVEEEMLAPKEERTTRPAPSKSDPLPVQPAATQTISPVEAGDSIPESDEISSPVLNSRPINVVQNSEPPVLSKTTASGAVMKNEDVETQVSVDAAAVASKLTVQNAEKATVLSAPQQTTKSPLASSEVDLKTIPDDMAELSNVTPLKAETHEKEQWVPNSKAATRAEETQRTPRDLVAKVDARETGTLNKEATQELEIVPHGPVTSRSSNPGEMIEPGQNVVENFEATAHEAMESETNAVCETGNPANVISTLSRRQDSVVEERVVSVDLRPEKQRSEKTNLEVNVPAQIAPQELSTPEEDPMAVKPNWTHGYGTRSGNDSSESIPPVSNELPEMVVQDAEDAPTAVNVVDEPLVNHKIADASSPKIDSTAKNPTTTGVAHAESLIIEMDQPVTGEALNQSSGPVSRDSKAVTNTVRSQEVEVTSTSQGPDASRVSQPEMPSNDSAQAVRNTFGTTVAQGSKEVTSQTNVLEETSQPTPKSEPTALKQPVIHATRSETVQRQDIRTEVSAANTRMETTVPETNKATTQPHELHRSLNEFSDEAEEISPASQPAMDVRSPMTTQSGVEAKTTVEISEPADVNLKPASVAVVQGRPVIEPDKVTPRSTDFNNAHASGTSAEAEIKSEAQPAVTLQPEQESSRTVTTVDANRVTAEAKETGKRTMAAQGTEVSRLGPEVSVTEADSLTAYSDQVGKIGTQLGETDITEKTFNHVVHADATRTQPDETAFKIVEPKDQDKFVRVDQPVNSVDVPVDDTAQKNSAPMDGKVAGAQSAPVEPGTQDKPIAPEKTSSILEQRPSGIARTSAESLNQKVVVPQLISPEVPELVKRASVEKDSVTFEQVLDHHVQRLDDAVDVKVADPDLVTADLNQRSSTDQSTPVETSRPVDDLKIPTKPIINSWVAKSTTVETAPATVETKENSVGIEKASAPFENVVHRTIYSNDDEVDVKVAHGEQKSAASQPDEQPTRMDDLLARPVEKFTVTTEPKEEIKIRTSTSKDEVTRPAEKRIEPNQMHGSAVPTNGPVNEAMGAESNGKQPVGQAYAQAAEVADQVIRHMKANFKSGLTSMHMQLNPNDLGAIDVEMVSSARGVQVTFFAEQASTGRLLETQLNQLRDSLVDSGVQLSGLNIGQHNTQGQKGGAFSQDTNFASFSQRNFTEGNVEDVPVVQKSIGQSSEVDYRI